MLEISKQVRSFRSKCSSNRAASSFIKPHLVEQGKHLLVEVTLGHTNRRSLQAQRKVVQVLRKDVVAGQESSLLGVQYR